MNGDARRSTLRARLTRLRVPRRVTWLAGVLAATAAALVLTAPLLGPSPTTVFSVEAETGFVEVSPLCNDELTWDLPPGEVLARDCELASATATLGTTGAPAPCRAAGGVTATLPPGSSAQIDVRGPGAWLVTFGNAPGPTCPGSETAPRVRLRVHGEQGDTHLTDAVGFVYRPSPEPAPSAAARAAGAGLGDLADRVVAAIARASANTPELSLKLEGRVVIGQPMQFGAGWRAAATPTLSSARLVARDRALVTDDPLTLVDEEIESGTIIDTHWDARGGGFDAALDSAEGFVHVFDDRLGAQVYQTRSIGLLPYASRARTVIVPRWQRLWRSPAAQLVTGLVVIAVGAVGLALSYFEARPNLPAPFGPARAAVRVRKRTMRPGTHRYR